MLMFNKPSNLSVCQLLAVGPISGGTAAMSFTFSSLNIGTASAKRLVVLMFRMAGSDQASTITIGGIPVTTVKGTTSTGTDVICQAIVPTGTTADIVITFASHSAKIAGFYWSFIYGSSATSTYKNFQNANSLANIPVQNGGILLGMSTENSTAFTANWSGIDTCTTETNFFINSFYPATSTDWYFSGCHILPTETNSTGDLSFNTTGTSIFGAAWR